LFADGTDCFNLNKTFFTKASAIANRKRILEVMGLWVSKNAKKNSKNSWRRVGRQRA
jgi:hypothetical protein